MFDPESPGTLAPKAPAPNTFRTSWWVLGLAGLGALVLAAYIKPQPLASPTPVTKPATETAQPPPGPAPVQLTDTIGKACLGLLLVYGAGWGLVRLRRRGRWPGHSGPDHGLAPRPRLRLAESLPLGHQRGTLHLVEVDGATLLLGSALDQVCLLWTAASDHTSTFKPVAPESDFMPLPPRTMPPPRRAGARPTARPESDWSRERTRLIGALLQDDQTTP